MTIYDPYRVLGVGYNDVRRPDPRIGALLREAVGPARTVVNVGAGTGAYEPEDVELTAVEPSATMIGQRGPGSATLLQAQAEDLPLPDDAFDVGLAILTAHHWTNPDAGFAELRRVSRRQVVLTWDPTVLARMWLVADYLPEIAEVERGMTTLDAVVAALDDPEVRPVPVPWDCIDGFLAAYWRRPHAYLDPAVRAGASAFARIPADVTRLAMARLRSDLDSGVWLRRHERLTGLESLDVGYRIVVSKERA